MTTAKKVNFFTFNFILDDNNEQHFADEDEGEHKRQKVDEPDDDY